MQFLLAQVLRLSINNQFFLYLMIIYGILVILLMYHFYNIIKTNLIYKKLYVTSIRVIRLRLLESEKKNYKGNKNLQKRAGKMLKKCIKSSLLIKLFISSSKMTL